MSDGLTMGGRCRARASDSEIPTSPIGAHAAAEKMQQHEIDLVEHSCPTDHTDADGIEMASNRGTNEFYA